MPTTSPTQGQKAILKVNNTTYQTTTGIKTAEIQIQEDIYDVTDLNSNSWKIKLGGLADYTIKIGGNFDLSDAQQTLLQADLITNPGTAVAWQIWPKGTGATTVYSGSGLIKTEGVKIDVKSEEQVTWDIEGSGPIVFVA